MTKIEGRFFDAKTFAGDVPFEAETTTRMVLSQSDPGPGLGVAVIADGVRLSFSGCDSRCEGANESHSEYLGDGRVRLTSVHHFHRAIDAPPLDEPC